VLLSNPLKQLFLIKTDIGEGKMSRIKVDYGIDLGTTNSAIARITNGKAQIIKTDNNSDTLPSCVYFNKKGTIFVGIQAYNQLDRDRRTQLKDPSYNGNVFNEFKRTMGTDKSYYSSNMDRDYNSEELSAEVLKKLKSLVIDEALHSIIITVPAKFNANQKEATLRGANLAGFEYCELLQEPVAASLAYGIDSTYKDGFWIVFDFGGGTFDAALVKLSEGIMKVIDTEGDNYLGGKNLDDAIFEEILTPYFEENYSIDSKIEQPDRKEAFRNEWKNKIEEAKIQLSFKDKVQLDTDLGDDYGCDDNGIAFELDLTLTRPEYEPVAKLFFQKAINLTKDLLKRNNLKGIDLISLLLVGGPTLTPLLRKMIKEQLTAKIDTSVDPMTVVAIGAALYASTIDIPMNIVDTTRDKTKIQLEIGYQASTVELTEFASLKLLSDKTTGQIPENIMIEVSRGDGAWSSGKICFNKNGEVIDLHLVENKPNQFLVYLYDDKGNLLDSEPRDFTILQGFKQGQEGATLPYHIGIEIHDDILDRDEFIPIKGLEKNMPAPVTGTVNILKTPKALRPGITTDYIDIPIYQGNYNAEGTKAFYNHFVANIRITGDDVPTLVPEKSDINLTLKVRRDEHMTFSAYFPVIDYTFDKEIEIGVSKEPDTNLLNEYIYQAKELIEEMSQDNKEDEKNRIIAELDDLSNKLEQGGSDYDRKMQVLEGIRKQQRIIDQIEKETLIPKLEENLKQSFYEVEKLVKKIIDNGWTEYFNMERVNSMLEDYRHRVDAIVRDKKNSSQKMRMMKELTADINQLDFNLRDTLAGIQMDINLLKKLDNDFNQTNWKDANKARNLINRGLEMSKDNPSKDTLRKLVIEIIHLMPEKEQRKLLRD
jgi:molecular chaperone DnaK